MHIRTRTSSRFSSTAKYHMVRKTKNENENEKKKRKTKVHREAYSTKKKKKRSPSSKSSVPVRKGFEVQPTEPPGRSVNGLLSRNMYIRANVFDLICVVGTVSTFLNTAVPKGGTSCARRLDG